MMRALRRSCFVWGVWLVIFACKARAQQPWTTLDSPTNETLWGATFGRNLFIAVGERGTILTSPDGLAWTARASGTDKWLLAVTYAPTMDRYVVVGEAGTILTSSDGIIWTAQRSGTTQRLNSVGWATKRVTTPLVFLAVGENGTALTSPNAIEWTPRQTGAGGWLRGLATPGTDSFIVTGHDGTILATSDAGETFQRRASGTTLHLDAVALFGNDLYATGTNFVLTRSTDRGITWSVDRTVNTDGAENGIVYNALVPFNNALIIAGDAGRLIDQTGHPWLTTQPLLAGWRAVAASRDRVIAVGTTGAIASAPIDPLLRFEHALSTSFVVDSIILKATPRIRANESMRLQWFFNGQAIPGANRDTLSLNTLDGAQNGTYTLVASSLDGSLSSSTSLTLKPEPNPPSIDLVDLRFRPVLSAPPGAIAATSDGRVYVAGQHATVLVGERTFVSPVRLAPNGEVDPTFNVPPNTVPHGTTEWLLVQPDGRLLVCMRVGASPATFQVVRLNTDGSRDPSFQPAAPFSGRREKPTLLADGRWIVIDRQLGGSVNGQREFTAIVRRFNPDGTLDPTFAPVELMTGRTLDAATGAGSFYSGPRSITTRDRANRIYVGVQHGDAGSVSVAVTTGTAQLFRLRGDGTLDPSFTPANLYPLFMLEATGEGLVARTQLASWARLRGTTEMTSLFRLRFDGTMDPTYTLTSYRTDRGDSLNAPNGLGDDYRVISGQSDGSIVGRALGHHGHFGIVRFERDGQLDRNFNAEFGSDTARIDQLMPVPGGQILVAGRFTGLAGIAQPFLARITPNTRAATTRLANVSVRARAGGPAGPLIAGYVTQGGAASVLARGAGPALGRFDIATRLEDPKLGMFSGPTEISVNDDWGFGPMELLSRTAARLGAFPFAPGSADSALFTTSPAGAYTVQLDGKTAAAGVALAEIYDATEGALIADSPRVINFSVRTSAGVGDETLIVGFTLTGDGTRNVVIRAIGPGLARFGVTEPHPDPGLTLFRGARAIATNDDWAFTTDQRLYLNEAFKTVGAFPLEFTATNASATSSKDAAILISLSPGSYTAHVTGKAAATGVALVEIYEVP